MKQLQRALREMLLAGLIGSIGWGIFAWITDPNSRNGDAILSALVMGFIYCPIVWGIYRLGRFVIIPR